MITGFNTDVEYGGVTYHVQTEDKGLETPLILSLVYVGGAILASKRTGYQDLIANGFDQEALSERLNRQHKLICAAIRAGRVEDLKKMGERDAPQPRPAATQTPAEPPPARTAPTRATPPAAPETVEKVAPPARPPVPSGLDQTQPTVSLPHPPATPVAPSQLQTTSPDDSGPDGEFTPGVEAPPSVQPAEGTPAMTRPIEQSAPAVPAPPEPEPALSHGGDGGEATDSFYIRLLDGEGDYRAGQLVTIRIHVGRGSNEGVPVSNAEVTVKILGTTFRPLLVSTETDERGLAVVRALLPRFTSGRAAILIRARAGNDEAELRRIIKQA